MIEWLRRRVRQAGAPSESSTSRDGVLSWSAETHALALGLGSGLVAALSGEIGALSLVVGVALGRTRLPTDADQHLRDAAREPAYAAGGGVVGWLLGGPVGALVGLV